MNKTKLKEPEKEVGDNRPLEEEQRIEKNVVKTKNKPSNPMNSISQRFENCSKTFVNCQKLTENRKKIMA